MPKTLNLIVACAENRVMGRDGKLPWRIPEDSKFFNDATAGQICVGGRICFESWPRAKLDGRRSVVVTAKTALAGPDVWVVPSLLEGIAVAETLPGELYITGGERIFAEALTLNRPLRLHLTLVHADVPGDRYFPEWRHLTWTEVDRRESSDSNFRYTFSTLER